MARKAVRPPAHLSEYAATWWLGIARRYELESHHYELLTRAAEALDRCRQAREVVDRLGMSYGDPSKNPKMRPECLVQRDQAVLFARLVRELALDVEPPPEARLPRHGGRGR